MYQSAFFSVCLEMRPRDDEKRDLTCPVSPHLRFSPSRPPPSSPYPLPLTPRCTQSPLSFTSLPPAQQHASEEMTQMLRDLRKECVIAFVGGSDLVKIEEQLAVPGEKGWFRNFFFFFCSLRSLSLPPPPPHPGNTGFARKIILTNLS